MEIDNQKSEPTAASVSMAAIVICSAMLFGAVSFLAAITLILSQGSEESIILTRIFPGFGLVQMTVSAVGVIGGICSERIVSEVNRSLRSLFRRG